MKIPEEGRFVRITMPLAVVRVVSFLGAIGGQRNGSTQFVYEHEDGRTGIFRNDGDWSYVEDPGWKEPASSSSVEEPQRSNTPGNEVVDRPWLQRGRRRSKTPNRAKRSVNT